MFMKTKIKIAHKEADEIFSSISMSHLIYQLQISASEFGGCT